MFHWKEIFLSSDQGNHKNSHSPVFSTTKPSSGWQHEGIEARFPLNLIIAEIYGGVNLGISLMDWFEALSAEMFTLFLRFRNFHGWIDSHLSVSNKMERHQRANRFIMHRENMFLWNSDVNLSVDGVVLGGTGNSKISLNILRCRHKYKIYFPRRSPNRWWLEGSGSSGH